MQNLSQLVQTLHEELRAMAYSDSSDLNQCKINQFNQILSQYFPQAQTVSQFKGKIEDIIIQMHQSFDSRIHLESEEFSILLNVYSCKDTKIELNDIEQIKECILLHFPK